MIRKDMIIAVLITFCLTATLFMVIPTNSSSGPRDYNPWYDVNNDGKIDVKDIYGVSMKYGTTATEDSTRNVNVTNWPQDRPLSIKKAIEKIVIVETFSGGAGNGFGLSLGKGSGGDISIARLLYNFEPKGNLINVTDVYVNYIWRADAGGYLNPHSVALLFWEMVPLGGYFDYVDLSQGIGDPFSTMPIGYCLRISQEKPSFNFTLVHSGMNSVELTRTDNYGDHVYFFSLVLFIEYFYLG